MSRRLFGSLVLAWISGATIMCVDEFAKIDSLLGPMTLMTAAIFAGGSFYLARPASQHFTVKSVGIDTPNT